LIFEIDSNAGPFIANFFEFQEESEVLFHTGSALKVLGVKQVGDATKVHLQVCYVHRRYREPEQDEKVAVR
jgi:hypothetical protein